MSNEQSKVVTKVIDVRHKAPDQAIHELMQAAKDGFAVTKVVTRFNHTHVYLETSSKQVSSKQVSEVQNNTSPKVGDTSEEVVKEVVKPVAKKTTSKTAAVKKVEAEVKDSE